ncbi:MAG TPA: DUF6351 family protein [Actinophytocola sp.]|nr:DUF6351 family protein [Actinophytocola sp.]
MLDSRSPAGRPARRVAWAVAAASVVTIGLTGAISASSGDPADGLRLSTVSNPDPDLVSGGDVLVRVTDLGDSAYLEVHAGGRDVTERFVEQPDGSLLGLVTGLREGRTTITATSGLRRAALTVTNHDRSGPVFSGEQQTPFYCETTAFGLEPAERPDCAAETEVSYRYRTTAGTFLPLPDPDDPPDDVATVTVDGREFPYVVRVEAGTVNRAVYETAVLHGGADPSPTDPAAGAAWNGRLVYTFGGGCNGGHHQGATTGGVLEDLFLSRGYGVASSTLNVLDTNCGPVVSAETAMMVKERFAEVNGPIRHTIGWGGSGGAIQQYAIADAYPGILDGIVPGISYPDPLTVLTPMTDCGLLNAFFAGPGADFTPEERRAVAGYVTYDTCVSWERSFLNRVTPTGSCPDAVPERARWDIRDNLNGVRCTASEQWVNQLGRDPRTGFVRSTLDNTGVQYGLAALESGTLSAERFVRLNAGIGGYNVLGDRVAERMSADRTALRRAYRSDLLNSAGLGLRTTPIIDQRTYLDRSGSIADIHTAEMSFVVRARLLAANGTADNQVIIVNSPDPAREAEARAYALDAMDRWLTAIAADPSDRGRAAKVVANKPTDLADGCYLPSGERITEPLSYPGEGRCAELYPVGANPRLVAGADLALTTLTCRLRPLDFDAYPVRFTTEQRERLRTAFPDGVCDHSRPGVAERPAERAWRSY